MAYTNITTQNYVDATKVSYALADLNHFIESNFESYKSALGLTNSSQINGFVNNLSQTSNWADSQTVQDMLQLQWHQCSSPGEFKASIESLKNSITNLQSNGWSPVQHINSNDNGEDFTATAFTNSSGQVLIVNDGTNSKSDNGSNQKIFEGKVPTALANSAIAFFDSIKGAFPTDEIILDGHSLGNAISQIVALDHYTKTGEYLAVVGFDGLEAQNTYSDSYYTTPITDGTGTHPRPYTVASYDPSNHVNINITGYAPVSKMVEGDSTFYYWQAGNSSYEVPHTNKDSLDNTPRPLSTKDKHELANFSAKPGTASYTETLGQMQTRVGSGSQNVADNPNLYAGSTAYAMTVDANKQAKADAAGCQPDDGTYNPEDGVFHAHISFQAGEGALYQGDPLVLDLDGDGIETRSVGHGIYFDLDSNGFAEKTGWVAEDDGVLFRDLNNDGLVSNGSELFVFGSDHAGNQQSLAALDTNSDGKIDSGDAAFSELKVFKGDGTILSMAGVGIASLNLSYSNTDVTDAKGNTKLNLGSYTKTDTTTRDMANYAFVTSTVDSLALSEVAVSAAIEDLPDVEGSGIVYNLQQAMARDTSGDLQDLVEAFVASTDNATQNTLLEQILAKWAGVDYTSSPFNGHNYLEMTHLEVAEKFEGHEFLQQLNGERSATVGPLPSAYLSQSYYAIAEFVYGSLMFQTQLADYFLATNPGSYEDSNESFLNLDGVVTLIQNLALTDESAAIQISGQFSRALSGLGWLSLSNYSDFYTSISALGSDFQEALDTASLQTITGTSGNDLLGSNGSGSWDDSSNVFTRDQRGFYLKGGAGDDTLQGTYGNDVFVGGANDDLLKGLNGDDTYVFGTNSAWDRIVEGDDFFKDVEGGNDTLRFTSELAPEDVTFTATSSNDLIIRINGTDDQVTISNQFDENNIGYRVENFVFSDGTVYTYEQIATMLQVQGTVYDETLLGSSWAETLSGEAGNDALLAEAGNDTLMGGSGQDMLYGQDGNDVLNGGTGQDWLDGGDGDDVYSFNAGDEQDSIRDSSGNDTLSFTSGIDSENVIFSANSNNDLIVSFVGSSDQVTIQKGLDSTNSGISQIETIQFADSTSYTPTQILDLLQTIGTSSNDTLEGSAFAETLSGGLGDDILQGREGNDTYVFNAGDGKDLILDEAGNNILKLGSGISSGDLTFYDDENNGVLITFTGSSDTVTIVNAILNSNFSIHLDDSTVISASTIEANLQLQTGSSGSTTTGVSLIGDVNNNSLIGGGGNDFIYGDSGNDTLDGSGGNDNISGGSGNDSLIGGTGNDTVYGENDDDTLMGGAGNDMLYGDAGNDVYRFNVGDGQDQIADTSGSDTVVFGNGLTADKAIFSADYGGNLYVSFQGNTDLLRINNAFATSGSYTKVENFSFTGGPTYTLAQVQGMLQVVGTNGSDSLAGSDFAESLSGGNGNDGLYAYGGDDTLDGGAGSDNISGGNGNDFIIGGAGNDTIYGENDDDTLVGGAGNDLLYGDAGDDVYQFNAGDGQDQISDSSGSDTVVFGNGLTADKAIFSVDYSGNLYVSFQGNTDLLRINNAFATSGSYTKIENFSFTDGPSYTLSQVQGMLQVVGTSSSDSLTGSDFDESMSGGNGNDALYAYGGNDTLYGGRGTDQLYGGTGDDIYLIDDLQDVINEYSGEGTDTVRSSINYTLGNYVENLTLIGVADISATGNTLDNNLTGNSGNNILDGGTGDDIMAGGQGNDSYYVTEYGDRTNEELNEGTDTVYVSVDGWALDPNLENEVLLESGGAISGGGNELNNSLLGNSYDNYLSGYDGNDTLSGGTGGVDTLDGGDGNDTYIVDRSSTTVIEYSGQGTDTVQSSIDYTLLSNFENVILTGSADVNATGNTLDNNLTGNSGNNILDGGTGDDIMAGGKGNDSYYVTEYGDRTNEELNEGTDTVYVSVDGWGLDPNLENEVLLESGGAISGGGNELNNNLLGNSYNNYLSGYDGNDTLSGGTNGVDTLDGGAGNDTYIVDRSSTTVIEYSGQGTDTVQSSISYTLSSNFENLTLTGSSAINGTGNTANNSLIGNSGNNTLDGGAGADTLSGSGGDDTLIGGSGNDRYQFKAGDGLDWIQENDSTSGNLDTVQFDSSLSKPTIAFFLSGSNLQIGYAGNASDQVTVQGQSTSAGSVERFEAGDGTYMTAAELNTVINAMASYASSNSVSFSSLNDVKNNQDLLSIVAAGWHS